MSISLTFDIRNQRRYDDGEPIFDLHLNGQFIQGASSEEKAQAIKEALEANDFAFLRLHIGCSATPEELIAYVRRQGWTFAAHTQFVTRRDGRTFFSGNLVEYFAPFCFLILNPDLIHQVRRVLPEVRYRDDRPLAFQDHVFSGDIQ